MDDIAVRLDRFRALCADQSFLSNRGLSNEVGLYIFAYNPREEMTVRHFITGLKEQMNGREGGPRVKVFDLYDILLDICRERRILDRIPQMEEQRGQDFMRDQIMRVATPEAYISHMRYDDRRHGDIIILCGVGRVYPYMRSHHILNNIQHVFEKIPVVMFYPGLYSDQSLRLFARFMDDNYYRAFNLI